MAIKGQSITITYTVWDTDTAAPKSGDVNNHTCRLSQNGGTFATATNTPADIGYGIYALTLTATETNCDELTLQVSSSTSGVAIPPIQITFDESSAAPSAAAVASAVWNYTSGRTITNTIPSAADIADAVWDEIVFGRSPLVTDSAADILITAAATGTPSSIWNYANRSLTSEVLTRDENYQPIKTLAISSEITTAKDAILTRGNSAWITATGFSTFNPSTDTVIINATQAATMVTATGFATPSDLSGLSTFDPANDKVTLNTTEDTTLSAIKTKVDTLNNTDLTGIATAANITTAQNAIINAMPDISGLSTFDAANDTVTINATQAATMVTADVSGLATPSDIPTSDISAIKTKVDSLHNTDLTGIATSANVSTAQTAIISHGDENWTGGGSGGGGITAEDVWKYSGTYGRSLTVSPTDISSLATKTDLTTAQTAIVNAMPTIPTDYAKASDLTGLSTFNAATDTVTINSTQAATMVTATGFATPANITTAQAVIIAHGDENWVGGGEGGGATPKQIWEYADRTLTAAPSSLATKTDLTTAVSGLSTFNAATDKVTIKDAQLEDIASDVWAHTLYLQNVGYTAGTILAGTMGLSDAILDATDTITTYGDNHWTTAVVPTADITHIKNKVDTLHNTDLTGIATSTDITAAQAAILNAVPTAVWGDTTIYSGNSKGNKLSTIERLSQSMPGMIWMVDADYGASSEGTMGQAIYNMFNDHATSSEIAAVQDAIEDISIDTSDLAKSSEVAVLAELQKDLNAGVLNWSVTANALTIYNDNNTVRGTYTLTRDTDGNITRILPNS